MLILRGHIASVISIHALREEGDLPHRKRFSSAILFLSTPSARRATEHRLCSFGGQTHFYPRPPRGGRPQRPRRAVR